MAQAASINTAIRQVMSRGRPPKSTSPVRLTHTELIAALARNTPRPIYPGENALDGRAEHLEKAFAALHGYLTVIIGDTAQNIRGDALDRHYIDNLFQTLLPDAVQLIRNPAELMREDKKRTVP